MSSVATDGATVEREDTSFADDDIETWLILGVQYLGSEQCRILTKVVFPEEIDEEEEEKEEDEASVGSFLSLPSLNLVETKTGDNKIDKVNEESDIFSQEKLKDSKEVNEENMKKNKKNKKNKVKQFDVYTLDEISLLIRSERDIYFAIYEVDRDLNVINEVIGSTQLITFKEVDYNICKFSLPLSLFFSPRIKFNANLHLVKR